MFFLNNFAFCVPASEDLGSRLSAVINNDPAIAGGRISVKVKALNGPVIYSKCENLPLIPASNMKIITSVAALGELGANYKYKTALYGGSIDIITGAMYGPVVLSGGGDPTWMYEFLNCPTDVLELFADRLYSLGVRRVEGDLIADDLFFDRKFTPYGWADEQECYTSPASALSLNANLVSVRVCAGKVFVYPEASNIKVINHLGGGGFLSVSRYAYNDTILIEGRSPRDFTRVLPVYNPSLCTIFAFKNILNKKGIYVAGRTRMISELEGSLKSALFKWHEYNSCYLINIIKKMNKESDNFLAEQLFKTISAASSGVGTFSGSQDKILDFCGKINLDTFGIKIFDGSGLSLKNRVSANLLTSFLEYIYNSDYRESFLSTLPRGGVDGTLRYRLSGVPVYAKTGSLAGVSSLSGYVKTRLGQLIAFSVILNNDNASECSLKEAEDRIIRTIAGYDKLIDIEKINEVTIR